MATIKLAKIDTRAPKDMDKQATKEKTAKLVEELDDLQNLLFAEGKHSILVIIQGMDASGKDGVVRNVFGNSDLNRHGETNRLRSGRARIMRTSKCAMHCCSST